MDRNTRIFLMAGLLVAIGIAGIVAGFASSEPDGLEKVAVEEGFEGAAGDHATGDSPLADYAVEGVEDERISTGLAGVIGVAITLAASLGLLYAVRRLRRRAPGPG